MLNVPVAAVKAVKQVEGGGIGILSGKPVILFEPHIYWRELKKRGIDPALIKGHSDMLYPLWRTKPYPKGQAAQWARFDRAAKINRDAAICACSWGAFQIMGFHFKACGCVSVQQFVNAMFESEDKQLELFCNYIKAVGLDDELRAFGNPALLLNASKQFAAGYNGAYYFRNKYDEKLRAAYRSFA